MRLLLLVSALAFVSTVVNSDYVITLQLNEYNAGQGFLANGTHCNEFWFRGSKCNINLKVGVGLSWSDTTCNPTVDLGNVTTNENAVTFGDNSVFKDWTNPMHFVGNGTYDGFVLCVEANNQQGTTVQLIDSFTTTPVKPNSNADFTFYSHPRDKSPEPTLIGFAWVVTGDVPNPYPQPTTSPAPTTSTVSGATTTTTAAPAIYSDCNDVANNNKVSGLYNITLPNKEVVLVYCEIDSTSKAAETIIQSRGETNATDYPFYTLEYDAFKKVYGKAHSSGNFWLGLDNMNSLTNSQTYNMVIRVCCGDKLVYSQFYDNVTVGNEENGYIINGKAEGSYGLGFSYPKTDFGQRFSTFKHYSNTSLPQSLCKIANDTLTTNGYIGGWWFGNCGTNLNGHYYPINDDTYSNKATCLLDSEKSIVNGPGIELKSDVTIGTPFFDYYSYTRVRMSIYRQTKGVVKNSNICTIS